MMFVRYEHVRTEVSHKSDRQLSDGLFKTAQSSWTYSGLANPAPISKTGGLVDCHSVWPPVHCILKGIPHTQAWGRSLIYQRQWFIDFSANEKYNWILSFQRRVAGRGAGVTHFHACTLFNRKQRRSCGHWLTRMPRRARTRRWCSSAVSARAIASPSGRSGRM